MSNRIRILTIGAAAALALAAAGVWTLWPEPDFVALAEDEGITINDETQARSLIDGVCAAADSDEPKRNLAGAAFRYVTAKTTSDDERFLELGVAEQCPDVAQQLTEIGNELNNTGDQEAAEPTVVSFGQNYKFGSGLAVTMSSSVVPGFTPDEDITGDLVKLTVSVTNGTQEAVDPASLVLDVVSPQGGEAETWLVNDKYGLREADGDVLPGESKTFDQAVEVTDATQPLRVETSGASGDTKVYFQGSVSAADTQSAGSTAATTGETSQPASSAPTKEDTSGASQLKYGCEQGYIPEEQCTNVG